MLECALHHRKPDEHVELHLPFGVRAEAKRKQSGDRSGAEFERKFMSRFDYDEEQGTIKTMI